MRCATQRPLIVDVRRGSIVDGPGIRSVVFYKGCPLRCVFCHNPETQDAGPELAFAAERCLRCDRCASACTTGAVDLRSGSRIDRSKCDLCGRCAEVCPSGALRIVGRYWEVSELAELLLRDLAFYRHSGGGVTLSGGECTLFLDHLQALLDILEASRVHVALETSGFFDYEPFAARILPKLDLVLYDVKLLDAIASRQYMGVVNDRSLQNLQRLVADAGPKVHPRIPLIPGITDTPENLSAIVAYLSMLGVRSFTVLPYNPLGLSMYSRLGKATPPMPPHFTPESHYRETLDLLRRLTPNRGAAPQAQPSP